MPHIFDPKEFAKLDSPERKEALPAKDLLLKFGLKPGDEMLDFGAGTGFFALPAAKIIGPQSTLYALDISEDMLMELSIRAKKENIRNIVFLLENGNSLQLENNSIDFILLAFVFHEFEYREAVLKELKRVLRPKGKIVIFEWKKIETEKGPPLNDRVDEREVGNALVKSGFTVDRIVNLNDSHFAVAGKK